MDQVLYHDVIQCGKKIKKTGWRYRKVSRKNSGFDTSGLTAEDVAKVNRS